MPIWVPDVSYVMSFSVPAANSSFRTGLPTTSTDSLKVTLARTVSPALYVLFWVVAGAPTNAMPEIPKSLSVTVQEAELGVPTV